MSKIQVGKMYLSPGNGHLFSEEMKHWSMKKPTWFSIVMKSNGQFLGVNENGIGNLMWVEFDSSGKDEWREFGGNWYELDVTTEKDAEYLLTKVQRGSK
jgi:hypothetical protein